MKFEEAYIKIQITVIWKRLLWMNTFLSEKNVSISFSVAVNFAARIECEEQS